MTITLRNVSVSIRGTSSIVAPWMLPVLGVVWRDALKKVGEPMRLNSKGDFGSVSVRNLAEAEQLAKLQSSRYKVKGRSAFAEAYPGGSFADEFGKIVQKFAVDPSAYKPKPMVGGVEIVEVEPTKKEEKRMSVDDIAEVSEKKEEPGALESDDSLESMLAEAEGTRALEAVHGISSVRAKELATEFSIHTLQDLVAADADEVAAGLERVSAPMVRRWQYEAAQLMD